MASASLPTASLPERDSVGINETGEKKRFGGKNYLEIEMLLVDSRAMARRNQISGFYCQVQREQLTFFVSRRYEDFQQTPLP